MREFDYGAQADRLLTHGSVNAIGLIYKFIGEISLVRQLSYEVLGNIGGNCRLHTVAAGARNNGSSLNYQTIKELIEKARGPQNDVEYRVVRYARAVSSVVDQEYDHRDMMGDIVRLNNLLFYDEPEGLPPQWRLHNMPYRREAGTVKIDFAVPPHEQAPVLFAKICAEYAAVIAETDINPLYIMPQFLLDFVAIQPFDRGMFETGRLIISYLLDWAGLNFTDTISLEHCIQRHWEMMYRNIAESLEGWHQGTNDYRPGFELWIAVCLEAHRQFEEWTKILIHGEPSTKDIVEKVIQLYDGSVTKRMIMEYVAYISESSVEMALYALNKAGVIKRISGGRYSQYIYNRQGNS